MQNIQELAARLTLGKPQTLHNLTIVPLAAPSGPAPRFEVLGDALRAGTAQINELSAAGSVPTIKLTNRGSKPVLLLDGEELLGCKQNRIVNLTILAPALEELLLPVSCVEMGRWSSVSYGFSESRQTLYAALRARKMESVTESIRFSRGRSANQSEIWDAIAEKSARMGAHSRSSAMSDMYEARRHDIDDYLGQLKVSPDQVGAAFFVNGNCLGLETFESHAACAHYLPKIAAGYAVDAIEDQRDTSRPASLEQVHELLSQIASCNAEVAPGVGLGNDIRLTDQHVFGAALEWQGSVIHLCGFARNPQANIDTSDRLRMTRSVIRRNLRRGIQ